jgi:phosphomannomutase
LLKMSLMISVSGIRGVVGSDFNPQNMIPFLRAFTALLEEDRKRADVPPERKVLIGRDSRKSGAYIEKIVHGTINALGYDTLSTGIMPTPAVLMATRELQCAGGIAITASHNPSEWNAFKFCTNRGLFFPPEHMARMKDERLLPLAPWEPAKPGTCSEHDAVDLYIKKVLEAFNVRIIQDKKLTVAFDPAGGAGASVDRPFLQNLGCTPMGVHEEVTGEFPRGPEPVPENLSDLCRLVRSSEAEVGFAQDPDADRLAIVDETGTPLGEEYTLVLAGEAFLRRKKTPIACNLSTSLMVDRLAARHGVEVVRTMIGEANVTGEILDQGLGYGGEGNGGVIVPAVNPCRDTLVGMGLILELLAVEEKPLSELVRGMPSFVMKKTKVSLSSPPAGEWYEKMLEKGRKYFKNHEYSTLDGIKYYTTDEWLHIRGSNTEPVARIIAESPERKRTEELIRIGAMLIKSH